MSIQTKPLSNSTKKHIKNFVTHDILSYVQKAPACAITVPLLRKEDEKLHYADLTKFTENEYVERLVKQMIYNKAVDKGLIDGDRVKGTFLF